VEIQLFDGDRLVFRLYPEEPLWPLLSEGELDAARLRTALEDRLRRLRPEAVGDTGYQHKDIEVLGEPVRVDVRNPANRDLIRTNDLYQAVRDARSLQALVVARLEPRVYRLARLLRDSGDGIPAAQLQGRLLERIAALASDGDDEFRREAEEAADPRAVFALVSELRDAGLAEEGADGVVRPTATLRKIAL
jgi:hypothetical protein